MNKRVYLPILLVIACVGLFGIVAQHRQLVTLQSKKAQLGTQAAAPADQITAPSEEPSQASSELLELRSRVTQLTERKNELAGAHAENENLRSQSAVRETNSPTPSALPPRYILAQNARWAGLTTPENTLQSFVWALRNHDTNALFQTLSQESGEKLPLIFQDTSSNAFIEAVSTLPAILFTDTQQLPDGALELTVELLHKSELNMKSADQQLPDGTSALYFAPELSKQTLPNGASALFSGKAEQKQVRLHLIQGEWKMDLPQ